MGHVADVLLSTKTGMYKNLRGSNYYDRDFRILVKYGIKEKRLISKEIFETIESL